VGGMVRAGATTVVWACRRRAADRESPVAAPLRRRRKGGRAAPQKDVATTGAHQTRARRWKTRRGERAPAGHNDESNRTRQNARRDETPSPGMTPFSGFLSFGATAATTTAPLVFGAARAWPLPALAAPRARCALHGGALDLRRGIRPPSWPARHPFGEDGPH